MIQAIKKIVKATPLYPFLRRLKQALNPPIDTSTPEGIIKEWVRNGKPLPPPGIFKRRVIEQYARKNKIEVFVETGTFLGETVEYCKPIFKEIISIELSEDLYAKAKKKFENDKNVHLYQGDSGEVIKNVLKDMNKPCLFWLDGHYSAGITAKGDLSTPIMAELSEIFNHKIKSHVILIDDARCFNGTDDYPTLENLKVFVKKSNPKLSFDVADDIIRIK